MGVVNTLRISDEIVYKGDTKVESDIEVPHGYGLMNYGDHSESGLFQNGELDGPAYINHHTHMNVGYVHNGMLNGWGLSINKGKSSFGVYVDGAIKVDITPFLEVFCYEILEIASDYNLRLVKVYPNKHEIFVGVPMRSSFNEEQLGFHFMESGDVYFGVGKLEDNGGLSGYFLHFNQDYDIELALYCDGLVKSSISKVDFAIKCKVFVNHAYLDFDIEMNYSPSSFLFDKQRIFKIVEVGETPDLYLVLANQYQISGQTAWASNSKDERTTWFTFPKDDEDIKEELFNLFNDNNTHPWIPDFDDYKVVFINNMGNANSDHLVMYRHLNCDDENYIASPIDIWNCVDRSEYGIEGGDEDEMNDNSFMMLLIPNISLKQSQLEEQWKSKAWYYDYPSLRDYVSSLAYADDVDGFFSWLFDQPELRNCRPWDLPMNYRSAFDGFLQLFPSLDDF